jgi:hypothetical protein
MTGFGNKGKWLNSDVEFAAPHHELNCFRLTGNSSGGDCRRLKENGSITAVKDGC